MSDEGAADAVFRVRDPESWRVFVERLRRPEAAAKQVGTLLVRNAGRAFRDQRLGEYIWKPRSVFVTDSKGTRYLANVAGIIEDMRRGATPPARRFEPRPALRDKNILSRSFAYEASIEDGRTTVQAGSKVPYAAVHQLGGETRTPIDASTKQNLEKWINRQTGAAERDAKARARERFETKTDDEAAEDDKRSSKKQKMAGVADGLRFLLELPEWRQRVPARPFLGVTDEHAAKIRRVLALNIVREGEGTSSDGDS